LLFNRGSLLHNQGDLAGAEACYREVIDRFERVFTPGHPDTLMARRAIGRCSWKKRNGSMPRRTCASLPAVTRRIWAPRTTRR
jgi:hypothetical protein